VAVKEAESLFRSWSDESVSGGIQEVVKSIALVVIMLGARTVLEDVGSLLGRRKSEWDVSLIHRNDREFHQTTKSRLKHATLKVCAR